MGGSETAIEAGIRDQHLWLQVHCSLGCSSVETPLASHAPGPRFNLHY